MENEEEITLEKTEKTEVEIQPLTPKGDRILSPRDPKTVNELRQRSLNHLKSDAKKVEIFNIQTPQETEIMDENDGKTHNYFKRKTRQVLHSTINLLLLLLIRIGPNLIYEDNVMISFDREINDYTGWGKSSHYYISLTYWCSATFGYILCFFGGILMYMYQGKIREIKNEIDDSMELEDQNSWKKYFKREFIEFIGREMHYPIFTFVMVNILLAIFQSFFVFGLYKKMIVLVSISRCLFGVFDAIHQVLHLFFLVNEFQKENIGVAIGFLISIWSFGSSMANYLYDLPFVWQYLYFSIGACFFSIFGTITYLFMDLKKRVFKDQPKFYEEENIEDKETYGYWYFMKSIGAFSIIHHIFTICFYLGILIFPFYYGGSIWNRKFNNNNTDVTSLRILQQFIFFCKAFTLPGFGALLDTEFQNEKEENIYLPPSNQLFALIFQIYSKFKYHVLLCNVLIFFLQ